MDPNDEAAQETTNTKDATNPEFSQEFSRVELREGMLRVLCHVSQLQGRRIDLRGFCQRVWPALATYVGVVKSKAR